MRENLVLELLEAMTEREPEVLLAALSVGERGEILDHPAEAVARDQVVGHQEGELIRRQRSLAQVANGEAARTPEGLEVEPRRDERCMAADAGAREDATMVHRVEIEPLEHPERDPLGHAFGHPLLRAPLAGRQLDLRDVRELMRDEAQPLLALVLVRLVVEQELAALADADGQ